MKGGGRMRYTTLHEIKTSKNNIDVFGGYNHNLRISENEFFDMKNLTSTHYPILSPRFKRGIYTTANNPLGMIEKDSLCYVDGDTFYMNGYPVANITLNPDTEKQLISMGAYVVIMPDKKYVNTKNISDCGSIEAEFESSTQVRFELCRENGTLYGNATVSATEPSDPKNMDLWIDTSSVPHSLKQYSTTNAAWFAIASTYIKISATGIGKAFNQYDGVTISGVESEALKDLNNTMIIWDKGDDYIVVIGILDVTTTQDAPITVMRKMPEMDFVIESENRLWGCRYGVALNGEIVNEIYSSKLGDFKNWNCFMGLSTDSYAASVGTDGQFTGAVTHMGYPLFFKENHLHKIYGNFPSNYQIQTTACRGVQKGSEKSLAIVNEVLFYKSRSGICAYDGSLPVEISSKLGDVSYSDAVAGTIGNKYYVSMKDTTDKYHLFVYDTAKDLWHKEDNTKVKQFCRCRGELYFIDCADNKIKTVVGVGTLEASPVDWMAETGVLSTDMPDKKYISKINVRMFLDLDSLVRFYIQYDSCGAWEFLCAMQGTTLRSFTVPIKPKRCDHMRIRIVGRGDAKIYSLTKTIEQGSDV